MKFGYDKRLAHLSSLILSEQLTRDEALQQMESTNYPEDLRKQDHEFIAKKLGVTTTELEEIFARPNVDYSEYPNAKGYWDLVLKIAWIPAAILRRLGLRR